MIKIGIGNLVVAAILIAAGLQLATDGRGIIAFAALAASIVMMHNAFSRDDDDLPPPQHPLYGA